MPAIELDRIQRPTADMAVLIPPTGFGHATFAYDVLSHLKDNWVTWTTMNPGEIGNEKTRTAHGRITHGYEVGSSGPLQRQAYSLVRKFAFLGQGLIEDAVEELQQALDGYDGTIVSSHAYLSTGKPGEFLVHADAGGERAMVKPGRVVFVPTQKAAGELYRWGLEDGHALVVGFSLGKKLYGADPNVAIEHFEQGEPIHAGFMFTGARPPEHRVKLQQMLSELLAPIAQGRLKFTIYTCTDAQLAYQMACFVAKLKEGLSFDIHMNDVRDGEDWQGIRFIWGDNQKDAIERSIDSALFMDIIFTMLGERFSWVTRKPIYPIHPQIGPGPTANIRLGRELGIFDQAGHDNDPAGFLLAQMANRGKDIRQQLDRANSVKVPGMDEIGLPVAGAKKIAQHLEDVIYQRKAD